MLGIVSDPFQVFKDDQRYSPCPFLIVNMNMEPQNRYKIGIGCHMAALSRGTSQKEANKDPFTFFIDIMTDELDWMDRVGFAVEDAHTKEPHVQLHAKVMGRATHVICMCRAMPAPAAHASVGHMQVSGVACLLHEIRCQPVPSYLL